MAEIGRSADPRVSGRRGDRDWDVEGGEDEGLAMGRYTRGAIQRCAREGTEPNIVDASRRAYKYS
jgi:hypothetical protein